jgi:hypothetical protein
MQNPFIPSVDSYQRDLDLLDSARVQAARYLTAHTQCDPSQAEAFIHEYLDFKRGKLVDPQSLVLTKDKHWDKKAVSVPFTKFLERVKKQDLLLSPSMAVYVPETVRQAKHAQFLEEGVRNRKKVKKEMNQANARGDFELAKVKNAIQAVYKENNNSYSGATVSAATMLRLKSTHSSLTSNTRTATSYANAANEKFLMGSRHYYSPEITKTNLLAVVTSTDLEKLKQCVEIFNLHIPSVAEVMACIRWSTDKYWISPKNLALIETLVSGFTDMERTAVVYVADLYHLHKHNPEFVMAFLNELSMPGDEKFDQVEDSEYSQLDDDTKILANFLNFDALQSRDVERLERDGDMHLWARVKATGVKTIRLMERYRLLIETLWLTNTVPSSIHAFPSAYRRAALISDTDSTMFTCQYWVEQAFGRVSHSADAKRIVFVIIYLVSHMVAHILAIQSANMGVAKAKLRLLAMKNEYYFSVISLTTRSKHYYASRDAKEGVMFPEAQLEVKGVGLRDSKVPKHVNDKARALMEKIIATFKAEKLICMRDLLKDVGDIEREIYQDIERGGYLYMTTGQVKPADSYKGGENAPAYQQYLLWRDVFAQSLGDTLPPPYSVVKVSVRADGRKELDEWCERMGNDHLAHRLKTYLADTGKKGLTTILVPESVAETHGIPKEIVAGIDARKIIFNTMGAFYLMLESFGFFFQDKKISRLVSDYY